MRRWVWGLGVPLLCALGAAGWLLPNLLPSAEAVDVLAVRTPVTRTLQAAATGNGVGLTMATAGLRYKTCSVQIVATEATVQIHCSIDNGTTYNLVANSELTETDGCSAPPDECVLDLPISCTHIRAPLTGCTSCTNVTVKCMAEQ